MFGKTRLNIQFILIFLTVLILLQVYLFYRFIQNMETARYWSRHSYEVMLDLNKLQNDLKQNKLNYIAAYNTGNNSFVEKNHDVAKELDALAIKINDNHLQQQSFSTLKVLLDSQSQIIKNIIATKAQNEATANSIPFFYNLELIESDDKIESVINEIYSREQSLLTTRMALSEQARNRFFRFNFIAAIASYLILYGFIVILTRTIKEQRKLQDEKINANSRFQKLFNLSTDAHLLFDEQGIIDCNNAVLKMLKCYEKDQIIGKHPSEFSSLALNDTSTLQELRKQIESELKEKGFIKFEWMLRRFDGIEVQIEVSLTSITLDKKEVTLAIWHDISEQKKYQNMLEQLHKINANKALPLSHKINQIIKLGCQYFHLANGVMGKIENNVFQALYTAQNPNTIMPGNVFALTKENKPFLNLRFLIAIDELPPNTIALGEYQIGCFIGCPVYVNGKPFGSISYFKGKAKTEPFTETEKTFVHLISQWIGSEIESNITLKELEANKDRLERAIKSAHDGLWEWNCITNKVFVNQRYKEILGYEENDMELGDELDTFSNLIHADDSKAVWDAISHTFENNVPFNVKFRIRKKNGDYVLIHSRGNVERDTTGKPILMSGVITDLSKDQNQLSDIPSAF